MIAVMMSVALTYAQDDDGGEDPTADKGFAMCFDYGHVFGKEKIHTDNFSLSFGANVIPGLFVGAGPLAYIGGYDEMFYGVGGCADVRYTALFWKYRPYVDFRYAYAYDLEYEAGGSSWYYGLGICLKKKFLLGVQFNSQKVEYLDENVTYTTQQITSSGPRKGNSKINTKRAASYKTTKHSSWETKEKMETTPMLHFGWMF